MDTPGRKAWSYVRLSTAEQAGGHGRKRQMEASAKYCLEHDLDLQEELYDEASAYHGRHRKAGTAFHRFLTGIADGTVPPNSVLIVESLDRLDRGAPFDAVDNLWAILKRDITVVTLDPPNEFSRANMNFEKLFGVVSYMSRGHNESKTKDNRNSAKWKEWRKQAREQIAADRRAITARCPLWLRVTKERKFAPIPERAKIIQQIFHDAVNGMGSQLITKMLNKARVPTFNSKSFGWHEAYIEKCLRSRSVLGEFQPHVMKDDKRVPDGDPIKDYFPQIITDELFYAVQAARAGRKQAGKGRKSGMTNLVQGLAYCVYCNSKMRIDRHGKDAKSYLVCTAGIRSVGCGLHNGWRYSDFETLLLTFITRINLNELLRSDGSEQNTLVARIQSRKGKILSIETTMKQYLALFERTGDVDVVSDKIKDLKRQMDEERQQLDEEQAELNNLNASAHALATSSAEIKDLIAQLRGPTDDVFRLRAKVAERIRGLIEKIEFACIGAEPLFYLDDYDDNPVPPVLSDGSRWVHVYFKDGSRKVIIQKKTWDKTAEPEFEIIDADLEMMEVIRSLQPEELDKLAAQATRKRIATLNAAKEVPYQK